MREQCLRTLPVLESLSLPLCEVSIRIYPPPITYTHITRPHTQVHWIAVNNSEVLTPQNPIDRVANEEGVVTHNSEGQLLHCKDCNCNFGLGLWNNFDDLSSRHLPSLIWQDPFRQNVLLF